MSSLIEKGWSFDDLVEHHRQNEYEKSGRELNYTESASEVGELYDVRLSLTGTPDAPLVMYAVYTASDYGQFSDREESGDEESAMRDIADMIDTETCWKVDDCSVDTDGNYVPTFPIVVMESGIACASGTEYYAFSTKKDANTFIAEAKATAFNSWSEVSTEEGGFEDADELKETLEGCYEILESPPKKLIRNAK